MEPVVQEHPAFALWRRWGSGVAGRLNSYWQDVTDRDPDWKTVRVTVELVFGGDRHVRLAVEPLTVTSGKDGRVVPYDGGLGEELSFDHTYEPGRGTASARSFSFDVEAVLVNAADIIANGRHLAGYGEVCLQVDGGDYDQRIVVLRGDMIDGVEQDPDEEGFLHLSLTDLVLSDLPLPPWAVSLDRFPTAPVSSLGKGYPLVVNQFGNIPAVWVVGGGPTVASVVFAYGHNWTVNTSTGVKVDGTAYSSGNIAYGWVKEETRDARGVPLSIIRFDGAYDFSGTDYKEQVHVTATGGQFAENVVDAIEWLVQGFSGLGLSGTSRELFGTARSRVGNLLARVLFNAAGQGGQGTVFELVETQLCQSFPMISMVYDVGGYGPIVTNRRDGFFKLKLEPGVWPLYDRVAGFREAGKGEVFNRFAIRYAWDPMKDTYEGYAERNPGNSSLCDLSQSWAGPRNLPPIESVFIHDDTTAESVLDWLVEHTSLPGYYTEYQASPSLLLVLRRGDNVLISDDRYGWDEVPATVRRVFYQRGILVLGLTVWWSYFELGGGARTAPLP